LITAGVARRGVELHHVICDEQTVITISHQIDGDGRDYNPQGVDRLAPPQSHYAKGARSYDCQHQPRKMAEQAIFIIHFYIPARWTRKTAPEFSALCPKDQPPTLV
jgi:hypothetical protein